MVIVNALHRLHHILEVTMIKLAFNLKTLRIEQVSKKEFQRGD